MTNVVPFLILKGTLGFNLECRFYEIKMKLKIETHFFYPFGRGTTWFFERGGCTFKKPW
jgi:hypothetical protein